MNGNFEKVVSVGMKHEQKQWDSFLNTDKSLYFRICILKILINFDHGVILYSHFKAWKIEIYKY